MKAEKNKRIRRSICLVMVLVLALGLQGCGSKSSEPAESKETEAAVDDENRLERSGKEASDGQMADAVDLTDTVRWFNASYAILTELNGWDYTIFGGLEPTEDNKLLVQESLEQWWEVTDRQSADETLEWILTEGHRADFVEEMQMLEEDGFKEIPKEEREDYLIEYYGLNEDEAWSYAESFGAYEQYGENTITGWDCCRAMNLLSFYYIAGYYTEAEALDASLEIAKTIQPLYESWDELIMSYMYGYEYWAFESSEERWAVYEDLKTRADNPYEVDFKTALEKTW